jgi:hypothetical protein
MLLRMRISDSQGGERERRVLCIVQGSCRHPLDHVGDVIEPVRDLQGAVDDIVDDIAPNGARAGARSRRSGSRGHSRKAV